MDKNIRSKVVRESLLDYNTLAKSLEENSQSAIKTLLGEAVRDTYAKLLSEDDDKDYEEEEVEDTNSDTVDNDAESSEKSTDDVEDTDASMESLDGAEEGETAVEGGEDAVDDAAVEGGEDAVDDSSKDVQGDDEGDEWAEFDKYKVSDDEYDFSDAEDEEIVKVYKLMKNDDQILVHKDDNGNVNIQDNETGAEYLISLGDDDTTIDEPINDEGADDFGDDNNFDDMNESTEKMFELVMEYNSNVGYTDNYQKKDVMTTPDMSEPGKNVNDWDAGVPKGKEKPWSGYQSKKNKADKPFNAGKGKQVEEAIEECGDGNVEGTVEEATNVGGFVQQNSTSKSHVPNSNGRSARSASKGGKRIKGTTTPRYNSGDVDVTVTVNGDEKTTNESLVRKVNKTLKENKALSETLTTVMAKLKEAAVVNHNLAQIVKLISENTTSQDEKKEIINRFASEAKTIEQSKNLYESISRDLQKANKMNITENNSLTVESSKKINETTIYKSQDVLDSLDLMHRMMK